MEIVQIAGVTFQLDLSKPLYEQVLNQIRLAIARREIKMGDRIPSVRELAHHLKINPNTVMRAYQELERDRLTETRRGQGTFITSSPQKIDEIKNRLASEAVKVFVEAMKGLGFDRKTAQAYLEEVMW